MLTAVRELYRRIPLSLIYFNFAILVILATEPAWRFLVVGFTLDDLLSYRCF
jgi:hypothetical protein